jgi:Leucine-rich repeat (LRR) protein
MQLIGLFLTVALIGVLFVWYTPGTSTTSDQDQASTTTSYSEAIDAAKEVVEKTNEAGGTKVEVYDGLSFGNKTTVLDLSGRGLTGSLKAEVRILTALTELDLSNNEFTGIPAEIGQLSSLRVLNLAGNPVTGLPHELGNLQNLEMLDLRKTSYSKPDLDVIVAKLPETTTVLVD